MTKKEGDSTKLIFVFLFAIVALLAIVDIMDTYNGPKATSVELTQDNLIQEINIASPKERLSALRTRSALLDIINKTNTYDLPDKVVSMRKQFISRQASKVPGVPSKRPIALRGERPTDPVSSCLNRNGDVPLNPNQRSACIRNIAKIRLTSP